MQKKTLPGQRPNETLEAFIDRTWLADASLRNEFVNNKDAYGAFCRAEAAGCVRILGRS